jgi:hypothetical protein
LLQQGPHHDVGEYGSIELPVASGGFTGDLLGAFLQALLPSLQRPAFDARSMLLAHSAGLWQKALRGVKGQPGRGNSRVGGGSFLEKGLTRQ